MLDRREVPGENFVAGDFIFLIGEVGDAGHPICLTREKFG